MIRETAAKLIEAYRSDTEALEMIEKALLSIEEYHAAIYEMEIKKAVLAASEPDAELYRTRIQALDRNRTVHHNAMLVQINILNRMAATADLPPIYDGTVSEEHPFRRQVADAALDFAQQIILNRP